MMLFFGKKTSGLYFLFVIISVSIFLSSCKRETKLSAKKGFIDLSNTQIEKGVNYQLNGEWEFYFGKLLTPEDFADTGIVLKKEFVNVPQSWTKHKGYPANGCATYRLNIKTNKTGYQNVIICKRIFSAYKIWLNGKLIYYAGKVSDNVKSFEPALKVVTPNPFYLKNENELIIQVANYTDRRAGILKPVSIGEVHSLLTKTIIELILIISVLSIILIISIYHLILYLYRRNDYSSLLFSLLGFLFIVIGLMGNDTLLKNILGFNYNQITRFFHLAVSIYPALITGFFYLLYKKEVNKKFLYFIIISSLLLSVFSLFFSISTVRNYIGIKIIFLFIVSVYFLLFSLPKAVINKRQGAKWAFFGMLFLVITNINDVLFSLDILQTGYLAIYGFLVYIIFQSMNIAERFSASYKQNKQLTKQLRIQNYELKKAKQRAENADNLKSAFLANMSHEIRTPMNAILGFSNLLAEDKVDKDKRQKLTSYIVKSGNSLLQLINDIIDISKIEADQIDINKSECYINHLFEELELTYSEKDNSDFFRNTKLRFVKKYADNLKLITDEIRLKQVLINLINNALKFTENGLVDVICEISENNQFALFSVKDNGIGMTEEQKEIIFQRFTKLENEAQKLYRGAGLGLAISESIISLLGGKIWVESELKKGTIFYFTIPYNNEKTKKF